MASMQPIEIEQTIKMKGIRKIIAQRMRQSLDTAAGATHVICIDATQMLKAKDSYGKVSLTSVLVKHIATTIRDSLIINSTIVDDQIVVFKEINVSIAIALDDGLITPVIRNADTLTVQEIDSKIKELARKAKEGKISMEELEGGTFTVSNLGMYGIEQFTAIINPPQAAILALGTVSKEVVVDSEEQICIRPMLRATLTYDHRIVDGAPAAVFLKNLKRACETATS